MLKKLFTGLVLLGMVCLPIFGLEIYLPNNTATDDIATEGKLTETEVKILGTNLGKVNTSQKNLTVKGNQDTLFKTINLINRYLRWSFAVVATGLTVYAGYEAITAGDDKKALKKAKWTLIGVGVGLAIAMISAAIVRIITNLM